MAPKRNRKNSESPAADAMADCVLPEDLMLCILTRLPVKSIHRFKCVCKPLRQVLSSPKFAKMHRDQFPQNPENQSVVIWGRTGNFDPISLLKIESDGGMKSTKLDIPFPQVSERPVVVRCCNGLLCMLFLQDLVIALWNPALNNMVKFLPLSDLEIGDTQIVSVGFGYNEEADDFKVIIIVEMVRSNKINIEVYSANSNSWSTIYVDFHFTILNSRNVAIVNGSPYWVAFVDQKLVLVCFDVRKMVFKIVLLPDLFYNYEEIKGTMFVDWKGNIGALVRKKKNGKRVDVWVFDDVGWTKNRSFRLPLKVLNLLQCLKNGKILVGECSESRKLFVLDTENGKETLFDEEVRAFEVYEYTESLAYIKGMENLYETI